jgi:hypothetical protein
MQGKLMAIARVVAILLVGSALLSGCGKKVRRIDPESTTDLSGYWNDTDSRIVADDMISDCLSHPWIQQHALEHQAKPVVIVGIVGNRVVANPLEREELRDEREQQQDWATEETRKRLRAETGADYMLNGVIDVIIDKEGGTEVKFYQVDLYLTNIESNERVWIGQSKIKKEISRGGLGL